jgi:hypothetical protein
LERLLACYLCRGEKKREREEEEGRGRNDISPLSSLLQSQK